MSGPFVPQDELKACLRRQAQTHKAMEFFNELLGVAGTRAEKEKASKSGHAFPE
jgi:hypothetical protein